MSECHTYVQVSITAFIRRFCAAVLWILTDSLWPSSIIAGLPLITSEDARLPCQREAFSPAETAASMVWLRHTSEHDWCEESCQIRLSGFPPRPPRLPSPMFMDEVIGRDHQSQDFIVAVWLINDVSRGTPCSCRKTVQIIWVYNLWMHHFRKCSGVWESQWVREKGREREKKNVGDVWALGVWEKATIIVKLFFLTIRKTWNWTNFNKMKH